MSGAALAAVWAGRTDEQLAAGYVRGEQVCFDELVRRYSVPVYTFILRMVGRPQDAEDLTQDVFVQLVRSLPNIRTDQPLRPWIFVVARNKSLDHLKRRRPVPFSQMAGPDEAGDVQITDDTPLPDELAERADLQSLLERAIAALPDRYRAVVALRYSSDLTFAEIGEVLHLPENTVKTHFQRAKAMLRTELSALL